MYKTRFTLTLFLYISFLMFYLGGLFCFSHSLSYICVLVIRYVTTPLTSSRESETRTASNPPTYPQSTCLPSLTPRIAQATALQHTQALSRLSQKLRPTFSLLELTRISSGFTQSSLSPQSSCPVARSPNPKLGTSLKCKVMMV
jgi:hypothetical protein